MQPRDETITQAKLRALLHYDPLTGVFVWREWAPGRRRSLVAGCRTKKGYILIGIGKKLYLAHRLAWFYTHGEWPAEVDHKDLPKWDNRLSNLRPATRMQNNMNRAIDGRAGARRGLKGATLRCDGKKWVSSVTVNKRRVHLGSFDTEEAAHAAYAAAAELHYGEFARPEWL